MAEKSPSVDYLSHTSSGMEGGGRRREKVRPATDDEYRKLIFFMPTASRQVGSRAAGEVFERLTADDLIDIAGYLESHPEVVEIAKDTVLVTEVNRAAVSLSRDGGPADLIKLVRHLFAATPDVAKRVMLAHFEGWRNYTEEARILSFDGQLRDVVFSVTFPTPPELQDTTFITITDITERLPTEAQLLQLQADFVHAARISTLGEAGASIAHVEALAFVRHDIEPTHFTRSVEIPQTLPDITGERIQLRQVVVNLLPHSIWAITQKNCRNDIFEFPSVIKAVNCSPSRAATASQELRRITSSASLAVSSLRRQTEWASDSSSVGRLSAHMAAALPPQMIRRVAHTSGSCFKLLKTQPVSDGDGSCRGQRPITVCRHLVIQ